MNSASKKDVFLKRIARRILRAYRLQTIAVSFIALILVGGLFLSMPFCSRSGESAGIVNGIFTAASSVCVTGLVVVDTSTHWTTAGQIAIISLIQIGGLGFVTIATLFSIAIRRAVTLNERLLVEESLNLTAIDGIVGFVKKVFIITFSLEGLGALILSFRFIPQFGFWGGIGRSVFHAISAYCNAGFDLLGNLGGPFSSIACYANDWLVLSVHMLLIVFGGLGFIVWDDLLHKKKPLKWRLHTKIVLLTTFVLIVSGTISFYIFEFNNPQTLGTLSATQKILPSLFQSVTTRTAGFAAINQALLTDSSKIISMILMFIGGSPGSTAGGIKTTTIAVMFMTVVMISNGRKDASLFMRRISTNTILRAVVVITIAICIVLSGTIILSLSENQPLTDLLFEVVSAFATVGLSTGITPHLTSIGKLVLAVIMFTGRAGVLTLALSLTIKTNRRKYEKIRYPADSITVG